MAAQRRVVFRGVISEGMDDALVPQTARAFGRSSLGFSTLDTKQVFNGAMPDLALRRRHRAARM